MLGAGLPVLEAFMVAEAQASGTLQRVAHNIVRQIESGQSLAESFAKYKRYFSPVYIDVVHNGELGGTLAQNLQQLAERLENDLDIRRKIKTAMIYPMIVLGAVVALSVVLTVYVFPRLTRLFTSLDVQLPPTTRFLIWVSDALTQYWLLIIIVVGAVTIGLRALLFIPTVQTVWHGLLLRLPVIGGLVRNVNLARFTGTFGSLLHSGVPIAESLHSVINSHNNHVYRNQLRLALEHIERGDTLATFLEERPRLFPQHVARMIAVGERTGQLDNILLYLSNFYKGEIDSATKQLGATLEPVLLLVIGVVVLFVGISVITPVYEFTATIGRL